MDWNLKATSWDLTEFEQEAIPNIDAAGGSSNFGVKGGFSVDLKLGQVSNPTGDSINKWKDLGVTKMESSSSSSSSSGPYKRARANSDGNQTVHCLVDGCNSDLSNCRDYHRRHKVCELHSKTAQVTIGGQKQRFCQQCSRFHSLEEFDEGKRSCRKRLDGHNRRRRKPQPDPLARSGNFLSNYQGTQFLPFSSSLVYPSATMVNHSWAGVSNKADARPYNQHQQVQQNLFLGSSSSSYEGEKQFTFLQGDNSTLNSQTSAEAPICQPLLRSIALSESSGVSSHNMFCDRLTSQVPDSDCALSLLSSPQTQTSGIDLSNVVLSNSMPVVHPLGQSLHNHSLEPPDSVPVSSGRNANVQCPGMFQMGSEGNSANEAPQALPFNWE